ncbi:SPOC like C-terminal domain-containing protein [Fennellomyces sp. T-0311]|nr:SPOC like C-terminal domain-containing protein [Fennellomyces sp. T-0311]
MTSKKVTVFILESNPSMGKWIKMFEASAFQKSKESIQATLEEKLLAGRKTDQVSIVVAGTEETDHNLAEEYAGQYPHISELSAIKPPDLDLLRKFVNVPLIDSKKNSADVFSALIVTVSAINKHVRHYKYEKRIRLYMSLEGNINWDGVEAVIGQLSENGIELSIACLGLKEAEEGKNDNPQVQANLAQWKGLVNSLPNGYLMDLSEAIAESMQFHKKEIRPTPTFRGYLTIGNMTMFPDTSLSISIMMYARTMEAKMPSAKKWSSLSSVTDVQNANGQESHQVVQESKYRMKPSTARNEAEESADANEPEVEKAMLEKAYKFGKTLVTITDQDEEFLKLKTDASMVLLGTYSKNAFPPQMLMSNCYVIVAGNDRPKYAAKALSALAQALQKGNLVALVRHVTRADAPPKLGILKPVLQEDIDALYYIRVPFAEDVREYQFNSLDQVMTESGKVIMQNHPLLPSQEVRDAMSDFVKGMTISEASEADEKGQATLDLDEMYNPSLWLSKKAIVARALNPAAPIPEMDPRLKRQLEPSAILVDQNKDAVNTLKRVLNVKKVDREAKRNRYGGAKQDQVVPDNLPSVAQVLQSQQDAAVKQEEQPDSELRALLNYDTREVSAINPVRDFTIMINNREEDLVSDAVEQMCRIITELVTTSFGDRNYELAIECLVLLRATAAKEDESEAFNRYLYQLRDTCEPNKPDSRRRDFWDIVKRKHITLISSEEADDSNVTSTEATKFLEEEEPAKDTLPPESSLGDTADDLLAMME